MKKNIVLTAMPAIMFYGAVSISLAFAQSGQPGLYAFRTGANGPCPRLDWHVTLEPNGNLVGFVAWDNMEHMAKLAGSLNKDGTFRMEAHEIGGTGKTATVEGTATGNYINISINGTGNPCDGRYLNFPRTVSE
jgi:hypothetical protein